MLRWKQGQLAIKHLTGDGLKEVKRREWIHSMNTEKNAGGFINVNNT